MQLPPRPNPALIKCHLERWGTLENYRLQEESLALLFNRLCPCNCAIEDILLKVTALNQFYSTNIFDTYSVAKHIRQMNIDSRLQARDLTLVGDLAMVELRGKQKHFYSFASKYCSHHVPEAFPIYDAFVEKMLWHYHSIDKFGEFKRADLRDYPRFVRIITAFRKHYALHDFSLREIDVFLWLCGKDCFPKKYGKRKRLLGGTSTPLA